jgi:hypothetical protein
MGGVLRLRLRLAGAGLRRGGRRVTTNPRPRPQSPRSSDGDPISASAGPSSSVWKLHDLGHSFR